MVDYQLSTEDKEILARLQDFIPDKVFDAHAHLHNNDHMADNASAFTDFGSATAERFFAAQKQLYGNREIRAFFLPTPSMRLREDETIRDKCNAWLTREIAYAPHCAGAVYVKPGDSIETVKKMLTSPLIKGFKCYWQTSSRQDNLYQSDIGEYLPESAWQVANEKGMTITLHLAKTDALADPENLKYIQEMTHQYPNTILILAHCARGFASWTAIENIRHLRGIDNIYYDLAAICEPATIAETIRQTGAEKVLWGSDFCLDRIKGRPISIGNSFTWLYRHLLPAEMEDLCKTSTCTESLFAFYQACMLLDADRKTVEDIFYNNANALFGV